VCLPARLPCPALPVCVLPHVQPAGAGNVAHRPQGAPSTQGPSGGSDSGDQPVGVPVCLPSCFACLPACPSLLPAAATQQVTCALPPLGKWLVSVPIAVHQLALLSSPFCQDGTVCIACGDDYSRQSCVLGRAVVHAKAICRHGTMAGFALHHLCQTLCAVTCRGLSVHACMKDCLINTNQLLAAEQ
jgi:hypothetical protein